MAETTAPAPARRHTGGKRPLNPEGGSARIRGFRLLNDQDQMLDELARRRGVSPSKVLREALEREFKREGLTA